MLFEQIATGGCQSYLVGCPNSHAAVVIDPAGGQVDHYVALATRHGLRIRHVLETHTHADHFSAALEMKQALGVAVAMHANAAAPFVDMRLEHGQSLIIGEMRMSVLHTPGHTADSICLTLADHVFTGDTLLFGGTGRTDLPTGDPEQLHESLFGRLLKLDPKTIIHPAHDYRGGQSSTIGNEIASNRRGVTGEILLQLLEARLDKYGSAFADLGKGAPDEALSRLQAQKLKEIEKKARDQASGKEPARKSGFSSFRRKAPAPRPFSA